MSSEVLISTPLPKKDFLNEQAMIGHLWPKLDMERYLNVSGHMLPDLCSRNMNPLSPHTGRTVTSQTGLNSVKSYNHNSPNIWVEILVDSIFSWFGSKSDFSCGFKWLLLMELLISYPRLVQWSGGKISIFPSKMVQETIQYAQEMSQEAPGNVSRNPGVITGI